MSERQRKILDCTLRDGGYINNWLFSDKFIDNYFEIMNTAQIDYVEVGFINSEKTYVHNPVGKCRRLTETMLLNMIPEKRTFKIAVMLDLPQFQSSSIQKKEQSCIDMIRLAFHKKDNKKAVSICKDLKEKGYQVCANAMATCNYTEEELQNLVSDISPFIDYFYVADSYGCMLHKDIDNLIQTIQKVSDIPIGFHLHNNMQNGLSNMEHVLSTYHGKVIIDGTMYGMGRGAGNLPTELTLVSMERIDKSMLYDIVLFIDNHVKQNSKSQWGYELDFLFSAFMKIHPNYVVKMRQCNLSTIDILSQLQKVKTMYHHQGKYFDKEFLSKLLSDHQIH